MTVMGGTSVVDRLSISVHNVTVVGNGNVGLSVEVDGGKNGVGITVSNVTATNNSGGATR